MTEKIRTWAETLADRILGSSLGRLLSIVSPATFDWCADQLGWETFLDGQEEDR